jgi:hypothetical protein
MKPTLFALLALVVAAGVALTLTAGEYYDSDREGDEGEYDEGSRYAMVVNTQSSFAYLDDPQYVLYAAECGDCHLAYAPWLLPTQSWRAVMGSLADHFGDNAELDAQAANAILAFLERHAAQQTGGRHALRVQRATLGMELPLRITQTDFFRGQHHEIPRSMIEGNEAVGSPSRCQACHGGAERGSFRERDVRIPGVGRWDD